MSGESAPDGFWENVHAVAEAARNQAEIITQFDSRPILLMNCAIIDGEIDGQCLRVRPGGSIRAGTLHLRDGAVIRALPEGGFVIE